MRTHYESAAVPASRPLALIIISVIIGIYSSARAEGTIARWKAEAAQLADEGKLKEARAGYAKVLESDPDDGAAWREVGRLALAMGERDVGSEALERAAELLGKEGGIELYYLLGESYYSLGKDRRAAAAHEMALELMNTSSANDRMTTLWRARIYARQGKMDAATALYRRLERRGAGDQASAKSLHEAEGVGPSSRESGAPEGPAESTDGSSGESSSRAPVSVDAVDSEAWLNHAEAYLLNKRFGEASQLLRKFLTLVPGQPRAVEMLAYALEGEGDLEQELVVRRALITNSPDSAAHVADYARALERAERIDAAVMAYKRALTMHEAAGRRRDDNFNSDEFALRLGMLEGRSSVEVGGHGTLLSDPLAKTTLLSAGLALPLAKGRHHLAFYGLRADADGRNSQDGRKGDVTLGGAALVLGSFSSERRLRLVCEVLHGTTALASGSSQWTRIGGSAELFYPVGKYLLLHLRGAFREAWRESAATFLEAGTQSLGLGRAYVRLFERRIVFDVGGMGRQLELLGAVAPLGMLTPSAKQLLLWAGFDIVIWADHSRRLAGDMLDERFVGSSSMASGVVFTARHYHAETSTDALFAQRLALVNRAVIEDLGVILRHVMLRGHLGVEARGGGGYDSSRQLWLARAGASFTMMPTARQRAVLSYDYAAETATGVSGERHTGMLSYRVDL